MQCGLDLVSGVWSLQEMGTSSTFREILAVKSECPLRPSEIENKWHMLKNQNSLYFAQR